MISALNNVVTGLDQMNGSWDNTIPRTRGSLKTSAKTVKQVGEESVLALRRFRSTLENFGNELQICEQSTDAAVQNLPAASRQNSIAVAQSSLPQCPSNIKVGWNNCQGTQKYGGGEYGGEWRGNQPNGQGTLTTNGTKYVGEFIAGTMNGNGTLTTTSGDKYVGEFRDGKKNGYGTLFAQGKDPISGLWQNNEFLRKDLPQCTANIKEWDHCQGSLTRADGGKSSGAFSNSLLTEHGTRTWPNGNKYVGQFLDGIISGQGIFTWANGDKYVGEFHGGKMDGMGALVWANGQTYIGKFSGGAIAIADSSKEQQERPKGDPGRCRYLEGVFRSCADRNGESQCRVEEERAWECYGHE
jgi:hypothetical protein